MQQNLFENTPLIIAGVDEAGRGPLVGNVVAAAVILDPNNPIEGLNDSKKLTEKKREFLFNEICEKALDFAIVSISPQIIDEINILQASLLAMKQAVEKLNISADLVQVDGNKCPDISIPCEAIVKGDSKVAEISAASILAKVSRDREMVELDKIYPAYGFAKHKGYPTALHLEKIKELGITPYHRKTFKPVAKVLLERKY